jgi:hypothetical protein
VFEKMREILCKRNRKGDATVLVFVLLALVVFSVAIVRFIYKDKIVVENVIELKAIEKLQSMQEIGEFYIIYIGQGVLDRGLGYVGEEFNEEEFKAEFSQEFGKLKFEKLWDENLLKLEKRIEEKDFEVLEDGGKVEIRVEGMEWVAEGGLVRAGVVGDLVVVLER